MIVIFDTESLDKIESKWTKNFQRYFYKPSESNEKFQYQEVFQQLNTSSNLFSEQQNVRRQYDKPKPMKMVKIHLNVDLFRNGRIIAPNKDVKLIITMERKPTQKSWKSQSIFCCFFDRHSYRNILFHLWPWWTCSHCSFNFKWINRGVKRSNSSTVRFSDDSVFVMFTDLNKRSIDG